MMFQLRNMTESRNRTYSKQENKCCYSLISTGNCDSLENSCRTARGHVNWHVHVPAI